MRPDRWSRKRAHSDKEVLPKAAKQGGTESSPSGVKANEVARPVSGRPPLDDREEATIPSRPIIERPQCDDAKEVSNRAKTRRTLNVDAKVINTIGLNYVTGNSTSRAADTSL